jgi:GNAT superfamily N-acetyltransferase
MFRSTISIRPYVLSDGLQVGQLIYDTVRSINLKDYSRHQVETWAPDPLIYSVVEDSHAFVAENNGKILGFGNITSDGYLHRFYVHRDFQNQGIGSILLETLEAKARILGLQEIFTEASITAKPFFLKKGYLVKEKQTKIFREVSFINFKMFKKL